jgi:hypothetical protein
VIRGLSDKWREKLEPVIQKSLYPISWDDAKKQNSLVFEGDNSVIVANDGGETLHIWLAVGDMNEVSNLAENVETFAKNNGYKRLMYCGRRGWIRTHGYKEVAVVSVKDL